jgi:aspartokinase
MALLVPDVGEVVLLASILYPASGENWTLKLYSGNVTPAETDTAASYTEATFTGYTAKTLTRTQSGATWAVPTTSTGTTSSTYGTAQVWSPTTSQSIYGYYVVGATSTTLLFAELFSSVKNLANNDTLTVTPRFQLD